MATASDHMKTTDTTPRIVPGQRVRHEGGDIVTVRCCDPRFAYVEFDDKSWTVFPLHSLTPIDNEPEAAKVEYQPGDEVLVRTRIESVSGEWVETQIGGQWVHVTAVVPLSDLRKP